MIDVEIRKHTSLKGLKKLKTTFFFGKLKVKTFPQKQVMFGRARASRNTFPNLFLLSKPGALDKIFRILLIE